MGDIHAPCAPAASASSLDSANWNSLMDTTNGAGTSTSTFTRLRNLSARSGSTTEYEREAGPRVDVQRRERDRVRAGQHPENINTDAQPGEPAAQEDPTAAEPVRECQLQRQRQHPAVFNTRSHRFDYEGYLACWLAFGCNPARFARAMQNGGAGSISRAQVASAWQRRIGEEEHT
ncbi:hypothetical protein HYPSUDRAFT_56317 [Hypholoma sublateritium FD-334 SS-4]|uniref:Uncharacterized protein n=1 Tax=Hypholoma sublateritium (strain FD-334 SS-4) TaxID=945553 RepID=A0A0D2NCS3_HYPSF|nr:hypothetical protein HYPSUDRAFT_59381 [Hypholoma sublateritium FD-334 SS-4]KJA19876.1 hypothetical protein HYPSUDRAFT_56317 [Hypholoma sublateritium FD-334 SS-4]